MIIMLQKAPIVFCGKVTEESSDAYGIYVDDYRCFFGTENGQSKLPLTI